MNRCASCDHQNLYQSDTVWGAAASGRAAPSGARVGSTKARGLLPPLSPGRQWRKPSPQPQSVDMVSAAAVRHEIASPLWAFA